MTCMRLGGLVLATALAVTLLDSCSQGDGTTESTEPYSQAALDNFRTACLDSALAAINRRNEGSEWDPADLRPAGAYYDPRYPHVFESDIQAQRSTCDCKASWVERHVPYRDFVRADMSMRAGNTEIPDWAVDAALACDDS